MVVLVGSELYFLVVIYKGDGTGARDTAPLNFF